MKKLKEKVKREILELLRDDIENKNIIFYDLKKYGCYYIFSINCGLPNLYVSYYEGECGKSAGWGYGNFLHILPLRELIRLHKIMINPECKIEKTSTKTPR